MKIIKYLILALFISFLSCREKNNKESEYNKYVKLLWKNAKFDWMPSSLISNNNQLYFADLNNNFYSVNIENANVDINFKTDYNPIHKPLIFKQNLFLTEYGNDLNCFDKGGKLKWKINGEINLRYDLAGYNQSIYGSVQGNGFSKINKTNGKVIWFLPKDSNITQTNKPAFFKETIYIGFSALRVKLLAINDENAKIIWENKYKNFETIRQYITEKGLLVLLDKNFKNGKVLMLNYENGNEIWSKSLNCDLLYEPCLVNKNIILSTYDNKIISLNIENGKTNWILNLNKDQADTNIINYKENVYFGTMNRNVYSVTINKGKINFIQPFNYGIITPIVEKNRIYFPTGGNEIWVLK
ncbi:PQQ-binding-like beta-propeller repeat protein [Flavobacterium sp. 1355]|jgi:outer membrane protein assembly factor BamB|uniref:outer membrane protein assembly factor BamB family protein n=1 Tax=Flavobacterium sp. 1355 TaxID=2806571 RepID=UPI001AE7A269|nr:PQQ-binding-like beta-propeller repeat protein [Flavobacterium sp. 1355]MBP1223097.1 outer membrane protein assembly factor BamB [Flavobacterium sp. 1355]